MYSFCCATGEDPLAISKLGEAYIQGLQYGPGAAGVTAADNPRGYKKIGSVAKHLSAYNFEGCIGHQRYPYCTQYREFFNAVVSETDLQETYWQAWRRLAPALSGVSLSQVHYSSRTVSINATTLKP